MRLTGWHLLGYGLLFSSLSLPSRGNQPLSFEARVRAQEAIERVYYANRIWPRENPGAKPPFEQAVSRAALEAKVERALLLSAVLERRARVGEGYGVTPERLQLELERVCRETRSPEVLASLFDALGRNGTLIQETLIRGPLAASMALSAYRADATFHGPEREMAQNLAAEGRKRRSLAGTALAAGIPCDTLRLAAGRADDSPEPNPEECAAMPLSTEELVRRREALRTAEEGILLRETEDGFVLERLLREELGTLLIESARIPKRTLDAWLAEQTRELGTWDAHMASVAVSPAPNVGVPPLSASSTSCIPDSWHPLGPLENRYGHGAIWTGSEMIVWGGNNGSNYISSGGRYNPATDSWCLTSTVNAPASRALCTTVWTGTHVLVWGGTQHPAGTVTLNSGGRYDAASDTWTPITLTNAPGPRYQHAGVWTGSEMIVWGGYAAFPSTYYNTGGRYNPLTDTWTATPTTGAPSARAGHSAVWTGSQMIVWGGAIGPVFATGARFTPSTNTWSTMASATLARSFHSAVWAGTEMVVWGGYNSGYLNTGERYNPTTNTWAPVTTTGAPTARYYHSAVWTGSEMVIFGGTYYSSPSYQYPGEGGTYDPGTDTWTSIPPGGGSPSGRAYHGAVWTGTEMVVWGGQGSGGSVFGDGARYAPESGTWTAMATLPVPSARQGHTAVWTGAEMIVWGGYLSSSTTYHNTGGLYDPALDTWRATPLGGAPTARTSHVAVWNGTTMLVWGGSDAVGYLNTGGRFNPTSGAWSATATVGAPAGRFGPTAIWTGNQMVVWGGYSGSDLNTGGKYDPAVDSWTATSTSGAPSGRYLHSAVWTGTEMIIWGGRIYTNTGGRYTPSTDTWQPTTTTGAPVGRMSHTGIWTGSEMVVWGGYWYDTSTHYEATGGRYSPSTDSWTATSTTGAPPGRTRHTAVWGGAEMIVWGGSDATGYLASGGRYLPATDSWGGVTSNGAPQGRQSHSAVSTESQMVVWGGYTTVTFNDGGVYTSPVDQDGDSLPDACDCAKADGTTWAAPGSARELQATALAGGETQFTWASPLSPGGSAPRYDLLRSEWAFDFSAASCVDSNTISLTAHESATPSSGTCWFYLIRAKNGCGANLGASSSGTPRTGRSCP